MYESPIELVTLRDNLIEPSGKDVFEDIHNTMTSIISEHSRTIDDFILAEIIKCDVNVDKDELVKALEYDRNQYYKGYDDGYDDGYECAIRNIIDKLKADYGLEDDDGT